MLQDIRQCQKGPLFGCIAWPQDIVAGNDAGAFTINLGNLILIMENSNLGVWETFETLNIFLFPSVLSLVTILIWSCFIL